MRFWLPCWWANQRTGGSTARFLQRWRAHSLITRLPKGPASRLTRGGLGFSPFGLSGKKKGNFSCISVLHVAVEWDGTDPSCRRVRRCFERPWTMLLRLGLIVCSADLPHRPLQQKEIHAACLLFTSPLESPIQQKGMPAFLSDPQPCRFQTLGMNDNGWDRHRQHMRRHVSR